nr:tRNA lysidine(34) synthetase TilS [Nitratifractor sp.]
MRDRKTLLTPHSSLLTGKNLLAFSHGLDSTALFHLLLENGIDFDIAMVNYGVREQAEEEVKAAEELADRYGLRAHILRAPKWESNFEAEARRFRYEFFESLIDQYGYETLLTAHQLDDRLAWFLMRMIRGAGTVELVGMEECSVRQTRSGRNYHLVRPLLRQSRAQLREYLEARGIFWFEDVSNADHHYERNRLGAEFGDGLMARYASGIRRTFDYLDRDRRALLEEMGESWRCGDLRIVELHNPSAASRAADRLLKREGYLLRAAERERIGRGESLVVGRRWAVEVKEGLLYLAPFRRGVTMPKSFRELCRRLGIPPKIRPYLYTEEIDPSMLMKRIGERESSEVTQPSKTSAPAEALSSDCNEFLESKRDKE